MENLELLHKERVEVNKQHAKRMGQNSKDWEDNFNFAMKALIESHATVPTSCWICRKLVNCNYIRCSTCVKVFCSYCDIDFHTTTTLHNRDVMQNLNVIKLKAKEFWDFPKDVVIVKEVSVPCFVPLECVGCNSKNTLNIEPSNKNCEFHKEPRLASMSDYVISGLWPGSPTRSCTLFSKSLLVQWFHLKHKTPSTAATKYVEVLEKCQMNREE
ncbi:hypothetical protein GHT06_011456 [Daphnia sinensis]|uniref:C2H2-type domain-containing protein n=1 Tax=Daphnia sinensis TaxID=1820382 RepID=A0AAD5PUL4_9CRUS|nr:hypothetical protein GHT06_011456 [Daphnia sinensis]